jgi:hypothetical protein
MYKATTTILFPTDGVVWFRGYPIVAIVELHQIVG